MQHYVELAFSHLSHCSFRLTNIFIHQLRSLQNLLQKKFKIICQLQFFCHYKMTDKSCQCYITDALLQGILTICHLQVLFVHF